MNPNPTSTVKVSFILAALWLLVVFSLIIPTPVGARPAYGITVTSTATSVPVTPAATATPVTPVPAATPQKTPDQPGDEATLDVQFGCNETCAVDGQLAAIQGRVRLIHQGSGWIAEGSISNRASTQFRVPYTGQYEVYLIEPPTGGVTVSGSLPKFLGLAETNAGLQLVNCPGACPVLVLAEPTPPPPQVLPETGQQAQPGSDQFALLLLWVGLLGGGTLLNRLRRNRS